ncbi:MULTISPECIES: hypothetical protein [unclassified Massilia]|uniref:hypothetical protein n=1 Tax=unclassified Massilia TaxID=2609279 RepID=UPI001783D27E|nr:MULTISPECIES: hypothetical protein [unclassified Massilia]MBD8530250.1 hypothetical protein [Massilia sp. CFBP 13647]MBD8673027.1 hypothetical protein [Massilia sp. CFBP 13721]
MTLLLSWQHLHGGVPAHHLLADPGLPALSNWWGLLTLPLLAWFLLGRVERRRQARPHAAHGDFAAFTGALVFGAVLSLLFTAGQSTATENMVQGLALLALFYPIHRAACVLGFVVGMTWTFGAVLPMIAAAIFAAAGAAIYYGVRFIYSRALVLRR